MGKVTLICVFLVFALLLEDGSSVRKKTEKEEKEDEEIQKAVNATLEAEEARRKEEEDEKKRKLDQEKSKTKEESGKKDELEKGQKQGSQGEACLPVNVTCPVVKQCPPQQDCPEKEECPPVCCGPCPEVKPCQPKECGPCPEVKPCEPCLEVNGTRIQVDCPAPPSCPESGEPSMTVPVAIAVGAVASLLVTGVATLIGLVIRYVPPTVSGLLFLAIIIIIWYLSSQYPATARELGGQAVNLLREAAVAVSHRIMAAIRHHDQVSFSILSLISSI
jgi:hypothetical protein